jgi:predicted AlkP superfamily pyrophosphatase or phosphodiesterase
MLKECLRVGRSAGHAAPRLLLAGLLLLGDLGAWGAQAGGGSSAPSSGARHVLVVSLDGVYPELYLSESSQLHIPNLLRLKHEGSYAEGVRGVYPSVTYPSHTTLVTGRLPAEHGIYTNIAVREAGKMPHEWFWYASAIKAPTLWDEARRHHLTTAGVSWPVTAGAAIDWNVPEIWDPATEERFDLQYVTKFATPGLIPEVLASLGPPVPGTDTDTLRARLAIYLIKKYRPNLMLVHLTGFDNVQHTAALGSPEAQAVLARVDERLGEIVRAVEEGDLKDSTDIFVVSDHGFAPIERYLQPNVLLVKAGLLTANEKGYVTGGRVATVANGGSFFIYWPEEQNLRGEVLAALKPLLDQGALWGVIERPGLANLGAEPAVQLALEAPDGVSFGRGASGEAVGKLRAPAGTHGYLPFRKAMEASFIAWGPRIKKGIDLHHIPMTVVAPTVLKDLGIDDPSLGEQPPLADLFQKE